VRNLVVHQDARYKGIINRSVQLVARNEQHSWRLIIRYLKKHTPKSPHFISFRAWLGRASRCTLPENHKS